MAAYVGFISARNKANAGDHFMHATEPAEERDAAAAYERLPHPGEGDGTLPLLRADVEPRLARAYGLEPGEMPTRAQVRELAGGYRADGEPLPRSPHSRRFTSARGAPRKEETPGEDGEARRRVDHIHVTLSPDIRWSLAHANAATPAGAAMVLAAVRAAADDTMAVAEQALGWTRRGRGGRLGPEPGDMLWIGFVHHTTRPDEAGKTHPGLHVSYLVGAAVRTEKGHLGAVDSKRSHGLGLDAVFQDRLRVRGQEAGMRVAMRGGAAVLLDVPDNVAERFAVRSRAAEADARRYWKRVGQPKEGVAWKDLPPERRSAIIKAGARRTQGHHRDGMADRPAWRAECAALGWGPHDVARPHASVPSVGHVLGPMATVRQQAAEMVSATTRTLILQDQAEQRAARLNRRPANLRAFMVRKAEEAFIATAAASVSLLAESRTLRAATAATLEYADKMGEVVRGAFARRRDEQGLNWAAKAVLDARKRETDLAALRKESAEAVAESVVTANLAAAMSPEKINAAFQEARDASAMDAAAQAVAATGRKWIEAPEGLPPDRGGERQAAERPVPAERPAEQAAKRSGERPRKQFLVTQAEAETQLREALRAAGMKTAGEEIVFDGRNHYLPVEGNRGRERSGAYRAYFDIKAPDGRGVAAAALYDWKDPKAKNGFIGNWSAKGGTAYVEITPEDAEKEKAQRAAKKVEQAAAAKIREGAAGERARREYAKAGPVDPGHGYLAAKGLTPSPDWRMDDKRRIVVPQKLVDGTHVNNEYIGEDGEKRPVPGARVNGAAWAFGELKPGRPVVLTEGSANGRTLHLATGEFTVAARSAGNLAHVAAAIREKDPEVHIVIAADNDVHLPLREPPRPNVGLEKAREVAVKDGNTSVWIPDAIGARTDAGKGTDFDDVRQAKGMGAVRASWERFQGLSVMPAPREGERAESPWRGIQAAGKAAAPPRREAQEESASQGEGGG